MNPVNPSEVAAAAPSVPNPDDAEAHASAATSAAPFAHDSALYQEKYQQFYQAHLLKRQQIQVNERGGGNLFPPAYEVGDDGSVDKGVADMKKEPLPLPSSSSS